MLWTVSIPADLHARAFVQATPVPNAKKHIKFTHQKTEPSEPHGHVGQVPPAVHAVHCLSV